MDGSPLVLGEVNEIPEMRPFSVKHGLVKYPSVVLRQVETLPVCDS